MPAGALFLNLTSFDVFKKKKMMPHIVEIDRCHFPAPWSDWPVGMQVYLITE